MLALFLSALMAVVGWLEGVEGIAIAQDFPLRAARERCMSDNEARHGLWLESYQHGKLVEFFAASSSVIGSPSRAVTRASQRSPYEPGT